MEITRLDIATFSCYPVVLPTEEMRVVSTSDPTRAWLPVDLEKFLFTENDLKTNDLPAGNEGIQTKIDFTAKSKITLEDKHYLQVQKPDNILYDQIAQLNDFEEEVLLNCFNTPGQSQSFTEGITMGMNDSSQQATLEGSRNTDGKLKENPMVAVGSKAQSNAIPKSPKTSRQATDHRRRREKANEREKQRIVVLKNAMNVLKNTIPAARGKTKITKLELLKLAQDYINSLRAQLTEEPGYDRQFESSLTQQVEK